MSRYWRDNIFINANRPKILLRTVCVTYFVAGTVYRLIKETGPHYYGFYWFASPMNAGNIYGSSLNFNTTTVSSPMTVSFQANGYSMRCVREP